jgi:ubiquinone/menaquinone biosynthesis C-methylase UbiE
MSLTRTLEPEVMDTVAEAVDYDSMDHAAVNRVFAEDLLHFLDQSMCRNAMNRAVDLGTGTALIPLEIIRRSTAPATIYACDLSVEMLKLAVRHVRFASAGGRILPVYCDAKQLPLPDQSCDVVMSNSIIHHIPEPLVAFREMRRILAPGGVLFVRDLMRPEDADRVEQFVQTYAGCENEHQQQLFRQSLHAALTVTEVEELLALSGFPAEWVSATSDRHWTIAGRE